MEIADPVRSDPSLWSDPVTVMFRATMGMAVGVVRLAGVAGPEDRGTNPAASTIIAYDVTGSRGAANVPLVPVTTVRMRPVGSVKETRAPATFSSASRIPSRFMSR